MRLVLGFSLDWIVRSWIVVFAASAGLPGVAMAAPDCPCDCRETPGPPPPGAGSGTACRLRLGGVAVSTARSLKIEIGTTSYEDTVGSDVVVITAGIPRKPGMSRDDLLATNAKIMTDVCEQVKKTSQHAIVIVVSNPLDAMVQRAMQVTGFEPRRIVGQAGVLDTARYRTFLAMELGVSVEDIAALLMGGHGDTMVPIRSCTSVGGIPVTQLIDERRLEEIVDRTRNGGAEIVSLLKTGSAYYAPSSASVQMVEAIVKDKRRILPCAAWLEGEYGMKGLFLGVPCKLGAGGLLEVLEVELTADEKAALEKSAEAVREPMRAL